jgi:hypothetical protein
MTAVFASLHGHTKVANQCMITELFKRDILASRDEFFLDGL